MELSPFQRTNTCQKYVFSYETQRE